MSTSILNLLSDPFRLACIILKRILKPFAKKSYFIAKLYGIANWHAVDPKKIRPILVFQMGKVGSTTIISTLRALNLGLPIYQVHMLSKKGIEKIESAYKNAFKNIRRIDHHLFASFYFHRQINKKRKGRLNKIITLVREPVGRNISSFFQLIDVIKYGAEGEWKLKSTFMNFEITVKQSNLGNLHEAFLKNFRQHDIPLIYYDREFKDVFGIDIYATEFPTTKGYKIYQEENIEILLIRLENLSDCAENAFYKFLGINKVKLERGNVGSDKEYAHVYQLFKKTIAIPEAYLDKMYNSRYARHFYSESEIEIYREKWTKTL